MDVEETNKQVLEAIGEHHTIRIVADVPTNFLRFEDLPASAFDLIKRFLIEWEVHDPTRPHAVDLCPRHAYIVVDINNHRYDYDTAHEQTFVLPVYILRLSKSNK